MLASEIQMGIATPTSISEIVDNCGCPYAIIYWYTVYGMKLGIPYNQISIEWALDAIPELANGLPLSPGETNEFYTYNGYLLYVYFWANYYSYDQAKWNLTTAYTNFEAATYGGPTGYQGVSGVYGTGSPYQYADRYYDEWGETARCFLEFYYMGEQNALNQTINAWNYWNAVDWNPSLGGYFQYRPTWNDFECEASFFLQDVLMISNAAGANLPNETRLTQDFETRFLQSGWTSYQWMYEGSTTVDHTIVHANYSNSEHRMQNTLGTWESLYGDWSNLNSTDRTTMDNMLLGNGSVNYLYPAWEYLYQSSLYDSSTGMFKYSSLDSSGSSMGSFLAYVLMIVQGTVPINAALAVPLSEWSYESCSSMIDPQLFSINFTANTLTLGVSSPGIVTFIYGSTPFNYTLTTGAHTLQFSSDWNSVLSDTVNNLPSRNYISSNTNNSGANISVTNVVLQQSFVQSGFVLPINVTLQNSGMVSGLANVELFTNSTSIFNGTLTVDDLASGVISCLANTMNLPIGNYTIIASAVPSDEPNAKPSTLTTGIVGVTYVGDLNSDSTVNFNDLRIFVADYVAYNDFNIYNPAADYNHDGQINFEDLQLFVSAYIAYWNNN